MKYKINDKVVSLKTKRNIVGVEVYIQNNIYKITDIDEGDYIWVTNEFYDTFGLSPISNRSTNRAYKHNENHFTKEDFSKLFVPEIKIQRMKKLKKLNESNL